MKFPITREQLQAYDEQKEQEEEAEDALQKGVKRILDQLCIEFKHAIKKTSTKKFIWYINLENIKRNMTYLCQTNELRFVSCLIQKVRETFIGCDICSNQIDTPYAHLIIDWS
jgi:c-di-AMP phosphodiesterase-like protein